MSNGVLTLAEKGESANRIVFVMILKATKESSTGLNTEFKNVESGRRFSREHIVQQIKNGNPNYNHYHTVKMPNGMEYVRSNADKSRNNNIE